MTGFDLYVFFLCLIVIVLLTTVAVIMITVIVKLTLQTIRAGAKDEELKKEYFKTVTSKGCSKIGEFILSGLLSLILLVTFVFSIGINLAKDSYSDKFPTIKVVNSDSMSKKHSKNKYLVTNNLNDQFQKFDLVLTYKIPDEKDLKLFDIVVYEVDGISVIHRIISIEAPSEKHPNETWYYCRGDANSLSDQNPVKYSQMKGIYRGERVPFVGSFVSFMQSPAGWICVLLVVFAIVATPIAERKIVRAKNKRLMDIGVITGGFDLTTLDDRLKEASDNLKNLYSRVAGVVSKVDKLIINRQNLHDTLAEDEILYAKLVLNGKNLILSTSFNNTLADGKGSGYKDLTPIAIRAISATDNRWACELYTDISERSTLILNAKAVYYENGVPQELRSTPKNYVDHKRFVKALSKCDESVTWLYSKLVSALGKVDILKINVRKVESGAKDGAFAELRARREDGSVRVDFTYYLDALSSYDIDSQMLKPVKIKVDYPQAKALSCELSTDVCYGNAFAINAMAEYNSKKR